MDKQELADALRHSMRYEIVGQARVDGYSVLIAGLPSITVSIKSKRNLFSIIDSVGRRDRNEIIKEQNGTPAKESLPSLAGCQVKLNHAGKLVCVKLGENWFDYDLLRVIPETTSTLDDSGTLTTWTWNNPARQEALVAKDSTGLIVSIMPMVFDAIENI